MCLKLKTVVKKGVVLTLFLSFFHLAIAQQVKSYDKDAVLYGVYAFGKHAGLLQLSNEELAQGRYIYNISFLQEPSIPDVRFGIPQAFGLEQVLSHQDFGVFWFTHKGISLFVKVDSNGATQRYVNGAENLWNTGQNRAAINGKGKLFAVRPYQRKSDSLGRVNGLEHIVLSESFEIVEHSYNDFNKYQYRLLDILTCDYGFGLVKESGIIANKHHFRLDLYSKNGQYHAYSLEADSFSYLPTQFLYEPDAGTWIVGGVYFQGRRLQAEQGIGHFMVRIDANGSEVFKRLSPWKGIEATIRRANPPQFLEELDVPMQFRLANIVEGVTGYQLVLESFLITNGLTLIKEALRLYEPGESVLTLKDLVVEQYDVDGVMQSQRIIEKEVASVHIMKHFDEVGDLEAGRYFKEQDLFSVLEADTTSILFLDVEKENVHLGYLNWESDSTFRTERVNFIAPDTMLFSETEQEFINKSRILKKLVAINNKADTIYAKSEAPAQKLAYSFMRVDYTPNRDNKQLYGLRKIGSKRLFWFEIMLNKQLIYYQYVDLP